MPILISFTTRICCKPSAARSDSRSEALTTMASLSALSPDEAQQVIADLFGDDAARATASYLLANDITASIARGWDLEAGEARGFSPIGTETAPFSGRFDGGGNRINDLFIRRPATVSAVGLFAQADAAFFANLEIANARVSGGGDTGALVGAVAGAATVTSVWAQGRVESTNEEADRGIGGLIGRYTGELTVARSWFAGEALGGTNVGGLIGLGADGATVNVQESWTAARVSATVTVAGGLLAKGGGNLLRSWAVGPVTASKRGGRLGWCRWRGYCRLIVIGMWAFPGKPIPLPLTTSVSIYARSQSRKSATLGFSRRDRRFSDFGRHQCDGAKRSHRRGLDAHQRCRIGFAHRLSGF